MILSNKAEDFQGKAFSVLPRSRHVNAVRALLRRAPVVAILGPRQSGKTTLATLVLAGRATRFDLEDPRQLDLLTRDPVLALSRMRGVVVLDEVQRRPELFPVLRALPSSRS